MTIELKVKKTIEENQTLFIETPAFYKQGMRFCKFIEGFCLQVIDSENIHWKRIDILSQKDDQSDYSKIITEGEPITEEQFNEAYCKLHNEMAAIQLQKEPLPGVNLGSYDLKQLTA